MSKSANAPISGEFLCVLCPNGCSIDASFYKGPPPVLVSFEGAKCKKGEDWIRQEIEEPMRTVPTSVLVNHGDYICASVRTSKPIPLDKVHAVMDALRGISLEAPVRIGQVVASNPAGTDTDIIATRNVARVG